MKTYKGLEILGAMLDRLIAFDGGRDTAANYRVALVIVFASFSIAAALAVFPGYHESCVTAGGYISGHVDI